MPAHQLTFGPVGPTYPGQAAHLVSDKPADVADLTCSECGATLFIYYRHALPEGGKDERTTEASSDAGGDHSPQPQTGQEQQKEGEQK